MKYTTCPKCAQSIGFSSEIPPLPEGLWFDCPACLQPFVLYIKAGEMRTAEMTRTGVPERAQS